MVSSKQLVIAHRGSSGNAPENTLAAFQKAIEEGTNAIELDVQLSADGEIVVIHDKELKRTTNGKGLVGEKTVSELKELDAGSWFSPEFEGEKIPLLKEVFELIPEQITINIELKHVSIYTPTLELELVKLIKTVDRYKSVIVSSFDHQALVRINKMDERIRIGLIYNKIMHKFGMMWYIKKLGIPIYSLHPKYILLRKKDVNKFNRNGYQVYPWTVDTEKEMKEMLSYGVQGVMTNYPIRLKKVMKNRKD